VRGSFLFQFFFSPFGLQANFFLQRVFVLGLSNYGPLRMESLPLLGLEL
jgi:hypothetical protein